MCIPPFFGVAPYTYNADLGACAPAFSRPLFIWYAVTYTIFTFIIPGALVIASNIRVREDEKFRIRQIRKLFFFRS